MNSTQMTWEDDDNNRQVRFRVDYNVGTSDIEIVDVVPTEVAFTKNNTTIGVHTDKGRLMLKSQLASSGRFETLQTEIIEKEGLLSTI